jgi:YD repeat-containing protein
LRGFTGTAAVARASRSGAVIALLFLSLSGLYGQDTGAPDLGEFSALFSRDSGDVYRSNDLFVLGMPADPAEAGDSGVAEVFAAVADRLPPGLDSGNHVAPYALRLISLTAGGTGPAERGGTVFEAYSRVPAPDQGASVPGAPLLRWTGGTAVVGGQAEDRIIARIRWTSDGSWMATVRYFYRDDGRLYERREERPSGVSAYRVLDEGARGVLEVLSAEGDGLPRYRRFDNRGRLTGSSSGSGSISVNYGDDGSRSERELLPDGSTELRNYDADNRLLSSETTGVEGVAERREFAYDGEGRILTERYLSVLGETLTTYSYEGDDLSEVESRRDGVVISTQRISADVRIETRYLRGVPVLRIRYENGTRVSEEEIVEGEVVRRREYGEGAQ